MQLTDKQIQAAQAIDQIYEKVQAELSESDEDPGVIDLDDVLQIALAAPGPVQTVIGLIGTAESPVEIANLLAGAAVGVFNDNLEDFVVAPDENEG